MPFSSETLLPSASFTEYAATFGDFDQSQLWALVHSQIVLQSPDSPLGHLLRLKEYDYLAVAGVDPANPDPVMQRILPPYLTGACLGDAVVQRAMRDRRARGHTIPVVNPNPDRRYLLYPDAFYPDDFNDFHLFTGAGHPSHRLLRDHPSPDYIAGGQSSTLLSGLRERWGSSSMEFDLFLGGLLHAFRLHGILQEEERLAPGDDHLFDYERHIPTGNTSKDAALLGRRVAMAGYAGTVFMPDGDLPLAQRPLAYREVWAEEPAVELPTIIEEVRQGVGGYVRSEPASPELVEVVFRESIVASEITQDDHVILRGGGCRAAKGGLVGERFLNRKNASEKPRIMGFCKDGVGKVIGNPVVGGAMVSERESPTDGTLMMTMSMILKETDHS